MKYGASQASVSVMDTYSHTPVCSGIHKEKLCPSITKGWGLPILVIINNGHTQPSLLCHPHPHPDLTLSAVHLHSQLLDGLVAPVQLLLAVAQALCVCPYSRLYLLTLWGGAAE